MRIYLRKSDRDLSTLNYCSTENCPLATALKRNLKLNKIRVGPGYVRINRQVAFTYECDEKKLMYPGPGFHVRLKKVKIVEDAATKLLNQL